MRFAFEIARKRASAGIFRGLSESDRAKGLRGIVTLVAKTNVLTFAHDLWMRTFNEVAPEYAEIKPDYQHIDACCMRLVVAPRSST